MNTRSGGTKRSSWLVFRRCLTLVRALLRGPQTREALIAQVRAELGEDAYPPEAPSAFKHDLDAIKREYGCRIVCDRADGRYHLQDLGELALLDLPDACLDALAFLESSFPEGAALPEHANIPPLLRRILSLLPAHRREQYQAMHGALRLQWLGRAQRSIPEDVLLTVRRACEQRRELEFHYREADGRIRRHRVAPYHIFYRPEGHAYLDATVFAVDPPGEPRPNQAVEYRLDRMVPGRISILPAVLPPQRPPVPTYRLRYWLAPPVARRRDVATYFPDTQIEYHADGSATVTACVTNLWQTRQILLRYGDGCLVQEPPELVEMFRETTRGLLRLYGEAPTPS